MSREISGEEFYPEHRYKGTRRLSHYEMSSCLSTERLSRRRFSNFETSRRLSSVGNLLSPVDFYDSDSDDVPEIDYSDPIHYTKRISEPKFDVLPSYKSLLGEEITGIAVVDNGKEACKSKLPQKKGRRNK